MSPSLAERLKTETRALHTAVERAPFMAALLRGQMARAAYCALLRNLHAIYETLESVLERHAQAPSIAPVFEPALWRTGALAHDLGVLHGPGWADDLPLAPAALAYVERLRELDAEQPSRLLAHAYVRYLGDLSGGQMLREIVARTLPVRHAAATAFYDFGDGARTRVLTRAFRAGLDAVVVDAPQLDELVDEAKDAFERHQRLFNELGRAHGLASA